MRVAIVHDYLTQRGGAERVVLAMARAFPQAPIYTSMFDASRTFPEFAELDVRTTWLDRLPAVRRHHRAFLPLYPHLFSKIDVDADVTLCSSSGWAHGVSATGRKVVYCHNTPRWLYQREEYLRPGVSGARLALKALSRALVTSDRRAAATAHQYVVNSTVVRDRVKAAYGIDADVVPPPPALGPSASPSPVRGLHEGFFLVVSRLMPYKNVRAVVDAFWHLPEERLVIVGDGPVRRELEAAAPPNASFIGERTDAELAWLYNAAEALVAVSYEDFGLTPLEAASFGKPSIVLAHGGYLDTMTAATAVFIDRPTAPLIAGAVGTLRSCKWSGKTIAEHAASFSEARFIVQLQDVVANVHRHAVSAGA